MSAEMTPTTDDVRIAYIDDAMEYGGSRSVAEPEFDRWLKQIKAEAWDEGHETGLADGTGRGLAIGTDPFGDHYTETSTNPYRGR